MIVMEGFQRGIPGNVCTYSRVESANARYKMLAIGRRYTKGWLASKTSYF